MIRTVIGAIAGAYLAVTSAYGTVYLSCLVVSHEVEALLWYVTVDRYAAYTMGIAATLGMAVGVLDARRAK